MEIPDNIVVYFVIKDGEVLSCLCDDSDKAYKKSKAIAAIHLAKLYEVQYSVSSKKEVN